MQCKTGKFGHESKGKALSIIKAMSRRNPRGSRKGQAMAAFKCDYCDLWHIGSSETNKTRRVEQ